MKSLLFLPLCMFIFAPLAETGHNQEQVQSLNLSDNYDAFSLTEAYESSRQFLANAASVIKNLSVDAYNQTVVLAERYGSNGPMIWAAVAEYGPKFITWAINNPDKVMNVLGSGNKILQVLK